MTHISDTYASKLAIAHELATIGCRAVTITAVARVKPNDARKKFSIVNGKASQPGMTPTDHKWFLANSTRRKHIAFLLLTYCKYRLSFDLSKDTTHDAHGLAFCMAYRLYLKIIEDPIVEPERFNLILSAFAVGWRDIIKGGSANFTFDNVKVINCKSCKIPHLAEAHYLNFRCSDCASN